MTKATRIKLNYCRTLVQNLTIYASSIYNSIIQINFYKSVKVVNFDKIDKTLSLKTKFSQIK